MKKFLAIILICVVIMSLAGCGMKADSVQVNVEGRDDISGNVFGKKALVEIGGYLYYDSTTLIVYWWNGELLGNSRYSTTPSPYYAPNGLPYRYNPETNTFEEIE